MVKEIKSDALEALQLSREIMAICEGKKLFVALEALKEAHEKLQINAICVKSDKSSE